MSEQPGFTPESEIAPPELTLREKAKAAIQFQMAELARRQENGELDRECFDPAQIHMIQAAGGYLTRNDVGNQPIVLSPGELEDLGYLEFSCAMTGDVQVLDPEILTYYSIHDKIVIFPEELDN